MTAPPGDRQLRRIERDTLIVGGLLTLGALAAWPSRPDRAAGVVGGLLLIALSYQGIKAGVDAAWSPPADPAAGADFPVSRPRLGFVKFFTRHAILAASAYVMMARFEFDPMAMLAGVTAPAVAASIESVRMMRARSSGSHSRLS
ncbi:MAG TPA: hypothetical protein VMW48_10055 [Vicinamibacterales bacterium]|nr:hypothetical protein [Vicinamibacterales bacterium]